MISWRRWRLVVMLEMKAPLLYAISVLFVFLCLAALYESWSVPFSVMLVVPLGVVGACVLFLFGRVKTDSRGGAAAVVSGLGRISYSVFLIHFPVCLVVNATFTRFMPAEPEWQALGMLTAWASSLAAGALFFRWVEAPLGRFTGGFAGQLAQFVSAYMASGTSGALPVRTSAVSLR